MTTTVDVHHHEGVLFQKVAADTGITYVAVDPAEIKHMDRRLLVRHGDPEKGSCGYYPAWLLVAGDETRKRIAQEKGKRPPHHSWIIGKIMSLTASGAQFL